MDEERDFFELNREGWNRRAEAHFHSKFYDVAGFLDGKNSLREIELGELQDVDGRRLLHLQCHFGLDTLSWARLGARATGVDISDQAIDKARRLAEQTGLEAQFVRSDVYSYQRGPAPFDAAPFDAAPFDIVFTSYGAVCWLPDLDRWARIVAENLAPGGTFYMAEFHPIIDLLSGYAYFGSRQPDVEEEGTYTEGGEDVKATLATWAHPIGRVLSALIGAGIEVERVNEYPFSPYDCFEGLVEREPGRFYRQHQGHDAPLVYTITGRRSKS